MKNKKCQRCGFCCLSLPNWNDLGDVDRALIRMYDKDAEELFKNIINGRCPNLILNGKQATCKIYKNRLNFCRAFGCWKELK